MTITEDPPRLLDPNSPIDAELREVLRVASTSTPSAAELQALALKVSAATAAGSLAGLAASHAHGLLSKLGILKLSAVVVVAGASAWFALGEPRAGRSPRPNARPPVQAAPSVVAEASPAEEPAERAAVPSVSARVTPQNAALRAAPPEAAAQANAAKADAPAARPAETRTPSIKPKRLHGAVASGPAQRSSTAPSTPFAPSTARTSAREAEADPRRDAPEPELTLLGRAQAMLARDPAAALTLLDQHARSYPHGQFVQEREALAIDALRRLGRRVEFQARAREFLARYPASAHRDRIQSWLQ